MIFNGFFGLSVKNFFYAEHLSLILWSILHILLRQIWTCSGIESLWNMLMYHYGVTWGIWFSLFKMIYKHISIKMVWIDSLRPRDSLDYFERALLVIRLDWLMSTIIDSLRDTIYLNLDMKGFNSIRVKLSDTQNTLQNTFQVLLHRLE